MNKFIRLTGKLLESGFRPISGNPLFFIFMFALGYACCMIEVPDIKGVEPYPLSATELFVDIYIVCAILVVIPPQVRRWIRAILYVILYPVAIIDTYCFIRFGSTLNPTMLLLAGETNGDEASEFLASYLNWDIITSDLGWLLLIALLHIGCNVSIAITRRMKLRPGTIVPKLNFAGIRPTALLGLAAICLFVSGCVKCWSNKKAIVRLMSHDSIGKVEHDLTRQDRAVLYLPIYRLTFSIYANRLTAKQLDRLIDTTRHIHVDSCSFRSKDIVFIIGESYNRHHAQLYGYEMPTTPRQIERERRGELVKFDDVVAPWNLTSFVFKHVFSLYSVGDPGEWCDYPLFPELFRKAGYHVTFITNQFLPQAKEAVYDFSGGFFLNNPVLSEAQFDTRNTTLHQYDDGVLADYDSLRNQQKEFNLTIFHLKGQHVVYRERYPQTRKPFKANSYNRPKLTGRERWILSDYDNAILYNDSIVDEILKRFEQREAIVIYMPDHGEECFGDDIHTHGRLHSAQIDYRLAHEEFEIPFWIWCSKGYAAANPDIVEQVRGASKRPFMTDNMPHLLLYLGGISCPDYRSEANPLGTDYDAGRPRILKNTTDYDKLKDGYGKE